MSVFKTQCFLFLRDPNGGVEDLDKMQAAGFGGVFCNIGDHDPAKWEAVVRPRALQRGMFCGPWARTQHSDGGFSPEVVTKLLQCADRWGSPLIVNSEAELKGTGEAWTTLIRDMCAGYDAALSMEPIPFADVHWYPLKEMPVLPQMFSAIFAPQDIQWAIDQWHAYGIDCVFPTFGTYGGSTPDDYDLNAPYSLYTADDCGQDYARWSPRAYSYVGCIEEPAPIPPDGGDDMMIGKNDGIAATFNRLRDLDPNGTLLQKDAKGKWPPLESLGEAGVPLDQWKAYDKGQRTLQILKDDHDGSQTRDTEDP